MYYLIYKITNVLNNKIYIGKHKTDNINDEYMGSGKILFEALKKYGLNNFKKEILFECKNEEEMNQKEKELVNEEFVKRVDTYNIKTGGEGGWDYCCNNHKLQSIKAKDNWIKYGKNHPCIIGSKKFWTSMTQKEYSEYTKRISNGIKEYYKTHENPMKGKHLTEETKKKIAIKNSIRQKGNLNSNYGHCWIYNDELKQNKNIKKEFLDQFIAQGWKKGRKMKYFKK